MSKEYNEGWDAAFKNQPTTNNPYKLNAAEHSEWLNGWWAGLRKSIESKILIIHLDHADIA